MAFQIELGHPFCWIWQILQVLLIDITAFPHLNIIFLGWLTVLPTEQQLHLFQFRWKKNQLGKALLAILRHQVVNYGYTEASSFDFYSLVEIFVEVVVAGECIHHSYTDTVAI